MNTLEQAYAEYAEAVAQLGDVADNIGVLEVYYADQGRARTTAATLLAQYTANPLPGRGPPSEEEEALHMYCDMMRSASRLRNITLPRFMWGDAIAVYWVARALALNLTVWTSVMTQPEVYAFGGTQPMLHIAYHPEHYEPVTTFVQAPHSEGQHLEPAFPKKGAIGHTMMQILEGLSGPERTSYSTMPLQDFVKQVLLPKANGLSYTQVYNYVTYNRATVNRQLNATINNQSNTSTQDIRWPRS